MPMSVENAGAQAKNYDIVVQGEKPTLEFNGQLVDTNVTHEFRVFFEWGFILQIITVTSSILGAIGSWAGSLNTVTASTFLLGCA